MMAAPVDLDNLRSMTDGDAEMEKMLFEEFFSSFDSAIGKMREHFGEDSSEQWRKEAHALKGISVNLGAMQLGELCKKAQDAYTAGADFKDDMLKSIKAEYEAVREFISSL